MFRNRRCVCMCVVGGRNGGGGIKQYATMVEDHWLPDGKMEVDVHSVKY